jgi:hypothetical protein
MKCIVCNQRKAKRFCPAKNTQICPQCCGAKRVLEIDCLESCEHLKAGREREAEDYGKRLRILHSTASESVRRALTENQKVIAHLEYALAQERRHSRYLSDKDVKQALELLLENYETEDNGILYEKTSDNLEVESLRKELRGIIESYRNPEPDQTAGGIVDPSERLRLGAAMGCLEFLKLMAAAYIEAKHSYVDFLLRVTPNEETSAPSIFTA